MPSEPICVIPARGGSKRIPRKNIIEFNGKPMIAWPIQAAILSGIFSKVVVSTDDQEIAEIARGCGAEIPFLRHDSLANDFATTAEVILDTLERVPGFDTVCCLYPTAPLVKASDLGTAYDMLIEKSADCVLSVTEYDFHPLRAFETTSDCEVAFRWPDYELSRSQDLPNLVHDAGMFYFLKTESINNTGKIISGKSIGYKIPKQRAIDIDTTEDLEIARTLHLQQLEAKAG